MNQHDETSRWVRFRIGDELYALAATNIREIVPYSPAEPVPGAPDDVEGVLNVRGEVIPVVSGNKVIETNSRPDAESLRIILVDTPSGPLGMSVDEVDALISFSPKHIERQPDSDGSGVITGTIQYGDDLIILLDLARYYDRLTAMTDGAG
jgi:purine-binding chemotaxis protein CheW